MLIICVIAIGLVGCSGDEITNGKYRSVAENILDTQILTQNGDYELKWDFDGRAVVFKNCINGKYWSDILYDSFKEGSTSANGNSPISITVANTQTLRWDTVTSYSQMDGNGNIACKKIKDGIRVTYFFENYKIAVPVDYTLGENKLSISIDSSKILEDGDQYKLISISVAPYFCSVKNEAKNGSLFVPSGSGAIMYAAADSAGTREYSGEVYGKDGARRNPVNLTNDESIKLPVFGAIEENFALMGIIEENAGACEIKAMAGNARLGYSNIYPVFYVRGYDEFAYVFHGKYQGITKRANNNISGQRFMVSYYPLYGEDAGYNNMAERYREYLISKGEIKDINTNNSPYAVTVLGGTNVTKSFLGIPYNKLVALTTFSQASDMLKAIKNEIGIQPVVRMLGYGDRGIQNGRIAGGSGYQSVYGSKNELENLISSGGENNIFFDYDIVNISKSSLGFSLNFNVSKSAILYKSEHFPVSPLRVNDKKNRYYFVARNKLSYAADYALKKADKYGIDSVSFSSLGNNAFSDYNNAEYINKKGIENDVKKILNNADKKTKNIAVANANVYAAAAADLLFDTSSNSGGYNSLDLEIPFYQMVFHSYKPMYSYAINLTDNSELATARAIAFGMGLGYTLTYGYVDNSDDLDEFKLYGTAYCDNLASMKKVIAEYGYGEIYSSLADSEIVSYKMLDNGISETIFSNGKILYVNQTEETLTDVGSEMPPYSFRVK